MRRNSQNLSEKCRFWPTFEHLPIADLIQAAEVIFTRGAVANLVAVADIEALVGAVTPDGVLYEARKHGREVRIISTSVDGGCGKLQNVGAAAWSIAA